MRTYRYRGKGGEPGLMTSTPELSPSCLLRPRPWLLLRSLQGLGSPFPGAPIPQCSLSAWAPKWFLLQYPVLCDRKPMWVSQHTAWYLHGPQESRLCTWFASLLHGIPLPRGWGGWMYHWLNGHEFDQTPGDSEGQGSLACCSLWGHKELDMT